MAASSVAEPKPEESDAKVPQEHPKGCFWYDEAVSIKAFQKLVWEFYRTNGRQMPWRKTRDPYHIVVSEIMLQQTQVERVIPYYQRFIKAFPTFRALARAEQREVLSAWQGLGYNRRALNLQKLAKIVIEKYHGVLPQTLEELDALPGIGKGTAGSLMAFVFNQPVAFIETNIRRVFIHHFFQKQKSVHDDEILTLVAKAVERKKPRQWYWALMDYGSHLGKKGIKANTRSAHYAKQSTFKGSNRQLRGALVRLFLQKQKPTNRELLVLAGSKSKLARVLGELRHEGFL